MKSTDVPTQSTRRFEVSLVRFAIHQDNELVPFPKRVNANFRVWLATQQSLPPSPRRGEGGREE